MFTPAYNLLAQNPCTKATTNRITKPHHTIYSYAQWAYAKSKECIVHLITNKIAVVRFLAIFLGGLTEHTYLWIVNNLLVLGFFKVLHCEIFYSTWLVVPTPVETRRRPDETSSRNYRSFSVAGTRPLRRRRAAAAAIFVMPPPPTVMDRRAAAAEVLSSASAAWYNVVKFLSFTDRTYSIVY